MSFDGEFSGAIRRDPTEGTYRVSYETDDHRPSRALVEAVAAIEELDPTELEPLGTVVDPNALDAAVRSSSTDCEMTMSYQRYHVTIRSGGTIELRATGSGRSS